MGKLYRVTIEAKAKLDEAAARRALLQPERGFSMPIERLRLGWAAYVDQFASKEDIAAAKLSIKEQSKPPATVKAPANGADLLMMGWTQLRAFVEKKTKKGERSALAELRGPALAEDVAAIEKTFKLKLPDDYLAWLALHDGGRGDIGSGPFPWGVLSLAMSAQAALRQQSLAKLMDGYDIEDDDERVKPVFWNKAWWPFSDSGGGDYKCLDLAPTKAGVKGQVIDWPHDDNRRTVEAPAFAAWVERLLDMLEGGEYVVENGSVKHKRFAAAKKPAKKAASKKAASKKRRS